MLALFLVDGGWAPPGSVLTGWLCSLFGLLLLSIPASRRSTREGDGGAHGQRREACHGATRRGKVRRRRSPSVRCIAPPAKLADLSRLYFDAQAAGAIVELCRSGALDAADAELRRLLSCAPREAKSEQEVEASGGVQVVKAADFFIEACCAADPHSAVVWLELLLDAGVPVTGRSLKRLMGAVIELIGPYGRRRAGFVFATAIRKGVEPDTQCFYTFFERCIPFASVDEWLSWMLSAEGRDVSPMFVGLIQSQVQTPHCRQAEFWLGRAVEAGVRNLRPIVKAVIKLCVRSGDLLRAEHWMLLMVDWALGRAPTGGIADQAPCAPDPESYQIVMQGHAALGAERQVERLFMQAMASGVLSDSTCFASVILVTCRFFPASSAMKWVRLARETGARLDMSAYAPIIEKWAKAGAPKKAGALLAQALQDGLRPGAESFTAVIDIYARQEQVHPQEAERLIHLMIDSGVEPTLFAFRAVLQAYARGGDAAKAKKLFEFIVPRGHVVPDAICYNALIGACAKAGDILSAEHWLDEMFVAGVAPNVISYTAILHACARGGDLNVAERGFESMRANRIQPNVVSYCALIQACVRSGDLERAGKWFNEMRAQGVKPNAVSYSSVLDACAKRGDWQRAERWLVAMGEDGVPPTVVCFNNVINACARGGRPDRAEAWLREVMGEDALLADMPQVRVPPGVAPMPSSFTAAAQGYAQSGGYLEVERILGDMRALGMAMDEFCLTTLITAYTLARPRATERAEAAVREYVAEGNDLPRHPSQGLRRCIGPARYDALLQELGLEKVCGSQEGWAAVRIEMGRQGPHQRE